MSEAEGAEGTISVTVPEGVTIIVVKPPVEITEDMAVLTRDYIEGVLRRAALSGRPAVLVFSEPGWEVAFR